MDVGTSQSLSEAPPSVWGATTSVDASRALVVAPTPSQAVVVPSLRPYQEKAITDIYAAFDSGAKRIMLVAPTGSGKTVIATEIVRQAVARGMRPLFVVDRITLVPQTTRHFERAGLHVGVSQASNTKLSADDDVTVGSMMTLAKRGVSDYDMLIIDEAHVVYKHTHELLKRAEGKPVVGLSATPMTVGLGRIYDHLVKTPSTAELTEMGYLADSRTYHVRSRGINEKLCGVKISMGDYATGLLSKAMIDPRITKHIIDAWRQCASGESTIVFAVTVEHSKAVRDGFRQNGISCEHIDASTSDAERKRIIDDFKAGRVLVLTSVGVLTTGFDAPNVVAGILARPTFSPMLHFQMLGRLLRPYPGKKFAKIIDVSGNVAYHGKPTDLNIDQLDTSDPAKSNRGNPRSMPPMYHPCSKCKELVRNGDHQCPRCGAFTQAYYLWKKQEEERIKNEQLRFQLANDRVNDFLKIYARKNPPPFPFYQEWWNSLDVFEKEGAIDALPRETPRTLSDYLLQENAKRIREQKEAVERAERERVEEEKRKAREIEEAAESGDTLAKEKLRKRFVCSAMTMANDKGYKLGWVFFRYRERFGENIPRGWVDKAPLKMYCEAEEWLSQWTPWSGEGDERQAKADERVNS